MGGQHRKGGCGQSVVMLVLAVIALVAWVVG